MTTPPPPSPPTTSSEEVTAPEDKADSLQELAESLGSTTSGLSDDSDEALQKNRALHGENRRYKTDLVQPSTTQQITAAIDLKVIFAAVLALVVLIIDINAGRGVRNGLTLLGGLLGKTVWKGLKVKKTGEKDAKALIEGEEAKQTVVLRNGKEKQIRLVDVVVGDLVIARSGYSLPADGVVVNGTERFSVREDGDEGDLPVEVKVGHDVFAGCQVTAGEGRILITAVGLKTRIAQSPIKDVDESLELPGFLGWYLEVLTQFSLLVAGVGFLVLLIWYSTFGGETFTDALSLGFGFGAAVVILALPESVELLARVTIAFSLSRMLRDGVFTQKINRVFRPATTAHFVVGSSFGVMDGNPDIVKGVVGAIEFEEVTPALIDTMPGPMSAILSRTLACNSFAQSGIDAAMVNFLHTLAVDESAVRKENSVTKNWLSTSSSKTKAVAIHTAIYAVGAADDLLAKCSLNLDARGEPTPLEADKRAELEAHLTCWNEAGLSVVAAVYGEVPSPESLKSASIPDIPFTLVGLLALKYPLAKNASESVVKDIRGAGIATHVISGKETAVVCRAGESIGLFDKKRGHRAMDGAEVRALSDKELDKVLPRLRVIGRATPADKLRVVRRLIALERGSVVVAGSGADDVKAMRASSYSVSAGISGTDLVKEASDAVALDESLKSLRAIVMWSRHMENAWRRFFMFQASIVLVSGLLLFLGFVDPSMVVYLDFLLESVAALALGAVNPSKLNLLGPAAETTVLFTGRVRVYVFCHVVWNTAVLLLVSLTGPENVLVIFNALVFVVIASLINARSLYHVGLFGLDMIMLFVLVLLVVVQVVIASFAEPITTDDWGWSIIPSVSTILMGSLLRAF